MGREEKLYLNPALSNLHIISTMLVQKLPSRTACSGLLRDASQAIVLCPVCSRDRNEAGTHLKGRPQGSSKDLSHLISSPRQCLSLMKVLDF